MSRAATRRRIGGWSMLEPLLYFLAQPLLLRPDVCDQLRSMLPVLLQRERSRGVEDLAGGLRSMQLKVDPINPTRMVGSVAVIDVVGPLSKQPGLWRWFGLDHSATLPEIEQAVNLAASDAKVSAILMRVDSPGGTVAGTEATGEAIFEARKVKPVWSQVMDCGCSAGYWLASQAERVYANRAADLANIGVVGALYDWSKMFEEAGLRAVVARSTPLKGIGVMGDTITAEHEAELTRWVKATHEVFVDVVARGRRMDRAKAAKLADARVLKGDEAMALGLIDGVRGLDETLNELARVAASGVGSSAMAGQGGRHGSQPER